MNIFNKYEASKGQYRLNKSLFWDFKYDENNFDWHKYRATVVQRVIQFGRLSDFFAAFDIYGGIEAVGRIALEEVVDLSERDLQFMCRAFNLKIKETRCYIQRQSRERRLNS